MRAPVRWIIGILFSLILLVCGQQALAQTPNYQHQAVTDYIQPNVADDVPRDQHTLVQSVLIESFAAFGCQLIGIDATAPNRPCLSANWQTNQLGYAPTSTTHEPQIGGLLGVANNAIGFLYTPVTNSPDYAKTVAYNFGIVKPAEAAPASGFEALNPLLPLWTASRNIAYFLLTIAFVFIGLGVMLRIRIDPRTVMTVQNRIPDIIICILLITFSYAISAVAIDAMWLTTYTGINVITSATDPEIPGCSKLGGTDTDLNTVSKQANNQILSSPFTYVDAVFLQQCEETFGPNIHSGILDVSKDIADNFVDLEKDIVLVVLGVDESEGCSFTNPLDCGLKWLGKGAAWFASFAWWLIVIITIIISVFRLLFELLKAYVTYIAYTIGGPIFIVMGLLPKKPLGFQAWLRRIFANLAIFVTTAWAIVFLRVVSELYKTNAADAFVPPLVGNPNVGNFGAIIVLGGLLMLPHTLDLIRDKMGAKPSPLGAAAGAGISAGIAAAGAVPKKTLGRLNKRDQHGNAMGPLARWKDDASIKALDIVGNKLKIPFAKGAAERGKYFRDQGTMRGYKPGWEGQQFAARVDSAGGTLRAPEAGMRYTRNQAGSRRHQIDQQMEDLRERQRFGNLGIYHGRRVASKLGKLAQKKARMGNQGLEQIPDNGSVTLPNLTVGVLNAARIQLPGGGSLSGFQPQETAKRYVRRLMAPNAPQEAKDINVPDVTPSQMSQEHLTTLKHHLETHYRHIKDEHKTPPPTNTA